MIEKRSILSVLILAASQATLASAWVTTATTKPSRCYQSTSTATCLYSTNSKLPPGISPFEKSLSKSLDIQGTFRRVASSAIEKALKDDIKLLEIDFPPLSGGQLSKSQFDDFDNIQELNANRDWCIQLAPMMKKYIPKRSIWLVLPDDKEVELCAEEWSGQLYKTACKYTSIRAACQVTLKNKKDFSKAWGSSIASTFDRLRGGDGILADSSALDSTISADETRLHMVCQPGNGGPVEDWINVEKLHLAGATEEGEAQPTLIVNGALDKVRDGYYPGVFFPALSKTNPFYKQFEPVFILKPVVAKGVYGWIYRIYPEPWQVILQTAVNKNGKVTVKDTIALVSDSRPSYQDAVDALVRQAIQIQN